MILVIDASVAIKWFVTENLHEEARRLLDGNDELHAPDLLIAELANVAWKKAIRNEIADAQAKEVAAACLAGIPVLHASPRFIERAAELALDLKHPVYDCLYVACAEALGGILVTADTGLRRAINDTKLNALVRVLKEHDVSALRLGMSIEKIDKLIELTKVMRATEEHVYESIKTQDPFRPVNAREMAPFFDSPSFRNIHKFIVALTEDERADLLALMWLGQGYSGDDWRSIQDRARNSIGRYANLQYAYLVGLTIYLQRGMELFQDITHGGAKRSP